MEVIRLFAAKRLSFRAKTGEGGIRRGACILIHQLIKTFFDKQGRRPIRVLSADGAAALMRLMSDYTLRKRNIQLL